MQELEKQRRLWTDDARFSALQKHYIAQWNLLFKFGELGDLDMSLNRKILANPDHMVTKQILYIYSMQSFIYSELNRTCRDKDES